MHRALDLAQKAALIGEVPIAAIVYKDGDILAEAHNRRELDQDPTGHAEIIALRRAAHRIDSWRLEGCTLAVTLEPCPMCAGALVNARVARLVYGATDPKMGCVDTLGHLCTEPRFNHQVQVVSGLFAEEAGTLLSDFFKLRRGGNRPPKPRLHAD